MSFHDILTMADLTLRDRVSIKDDGGEWVTGRVVELALLGDDMHDIRATLQLDDETIRTFDRAPDQTLLHDWPTEEDTP